MRRQNSVQNPPASPPHTNGGGTGGSGGGGGSGPSLRRQISDALSYFDAQELIENEQDLDYFSHSDADALRYEKYEWSFFTRLLLKCFNCSQTKFVAIILVLSFFF